MRFRAAVVQMACVPGDRAGNLNRAMQFIRQAATAGAKIVVLPEMFNTGYLPLRAKDLAETMRSATLGDLAALAKKRDLWIVGGMMERGEAGAFYNSAFLLSGIGVAGVYRKVHLWDREKETMTPGTKTDRWNCRLGPIGPLMCHDLEFPEQSAKYPPQGTVHLTVPSAFFGAKLWDDVTRARAKETASYLFAANRVGTDEYAPGQTATFCGGSRVVAPDGKVLVDAGPTAEGVFVGEVDPELVTNERKRPAVA